MNIVCLVGRLTKSPELKQTASGIACCRFTVAVDRPYQKDTERKADFINCTAWRGAAGFVARNFAKGQSIQLTGSIRVSVWQAEDGSNRYTTDVLVDNVEFNGKKETTTYGGDGAYEGYSQQQDLDGFTDIDGTDTLPF